MCKASSVPDLLIDIGGLSISPSIAQALIDRAVIAGYERSNLRWLITSDQRRMVRNAMQIVTEPATLRSEYERGGGEESGMFLGIPYVVRDGIQIRSDVIILEVVKATERVGMMQNCALDRWSVKE